MYVAVFGTTVGRVFDEDEDVPTPLTSRVRQ